MIPLILDPRAALFLGDSADLGQVLGENTVDAIVTDPPSGIGFMGKEWDSDRGGRDQWVAWLAALMSSAMRFLKPGGFGLVWALPRTSHWTAWALEDAGFEIVDRASHLFGQGMPKSIDMARQVDMHLCPLPGRHFDKHLPRGNQLRSGDHLCPEHPERASAEGVRSALKPAVEDWWLVRKPREGTYAENWLRYGAGGLFVDACRIGESGGTRAIGEPNRANAVYGDGMGGQDTDPDAVLGRWPAHLVLSHDPRCVDIGDEHACVPGCPVRLIDQQSGKTKSSKSTGPRTPRPGGMLNVGAAKGDPRPNGPQYDDAGGASRFFYIAKPARSEKDAGLDDLPVVSGGEATGRVDGDFGVANPRAGAGRTGGARNFHPSVKSVDLMRWLVRLVTPPGGVVLDVFAGSGTTGVAAIAEGRGFVGVEKGGDAGEYAPVVRGRILHALRQYPAK